MYTYAKVIRNPYGEYVVICYKDGIRYPEGDYFTNNKLDAYQTMRHLNAGNPTQEKCGT